jgi:hypothetical protein
MIVRNMPTWWQHTALEPRLRTLYDQIRAIKDDKTTPSFCANVTWCSTFQASRSSLKDRMFYLVGFYADHPKLRTMEAYEVAYAKLYGALPDCRNCQCL